MTGRRLIPRPAGAADHEASGSELRFSGDIDMATAPHLVSGAVDALCADGPPLIVDLSEVRFVDVCGAKALLALRRLTSDEEAQPVRLRGLRPGVRRTLALLGMQDLLRDDDG